MKIAFVLWRGEIGGAERLSLSLAAEMRRQGLESIVIFVADEGELGPHLAKESIDFQSLNIFPCKQVIARPWKIASLLAEVDVDAAIVASVGYLDVALRLGGYRGPIIGVEHGDLLTFPDMPWKGRIFRQADRFAGALSCSAEVAVSEYMFRLAKATDHGRPLVCIKNGVNVPQKPVELAPIDDRLKIGYVGRLIPGKGVDVMLQALARTEARRTGLSPVLSIAGEGPDRPRLEDMARSLQIESKVRFIGWTNNVPDFWGEQHLAVAPSYQFIESFCMSAAEAMAQGRPTLVSDRGALPELHIADGVGEIVKAGDAAAWASAMTRYLKDPDLLIQQGVAAHDAARRHFTLEGCAAAYARLARARLR